MHFRLTKARRGLTSNCMGLDAVEIVMAVEEAFDVEILDSEAEKIRTPGQLVDLVLGKTATATSNVCLTHRAFNLVRSTLIRRCSLDRREIRPSTLLGDALPRRDRRARLKELTLDLALTGSPELSRPAWVTTSLASAALVAGLAAFAATSKATHYESPFFLSFSAAIFTTWLGALATRALKVEFAGDLDTVGALARWVMIHKADLAIPRTNAWTRSQVADRVREIVINVLGHASDYREDADFIEDLGLD